MGGVLIRAVLLFLLFFGCCGTRFWRRGIMGMFKKRFDGRGIGKLS